MSQLPSSSSRISGIVLVTTSILAAAFAGLWLNERGRKPIEVIREVEKPVQVIKEVPVEKIKEVPKEVIKEVEVIKQVEVPAKLTDEQKAAIDFTARYFSAPLVKSFDEALYKLEAVAVSIQLDEAVKQVVSEDRVRNKFELILRKHNIRLDENAANRLTMSVYGLWDEKQIALTYAPSIRLTEQVIVGRKGDLRRVSATTWQYTSIGYAGSKVAEDAVLRFAEEMAESFANKLLTIRDRESEKDKSK